jgi:hypothetical protein
LLATHSLSNYQLAEQLFSMEPLNGRKPTELLAAMNKLRPADDAHLFAFLFLQWLPREVRVLLADQDVSNMQVIAEKADNLVAYHRPQSPDVAAVAAVDAAAEEETVAAVKKGGRKKRGGRQYKQRYQRSCFSSVEKRFPLCWLHISYGDKARCCEQPCAWPTGEN